MIHWGVFGGSVSRCCLTLLTVRFGPSEAKSNIWITEQHVQFQHTNRSALSRFFSQQCVVCVFVYLTLLATTLHMNAFIILVSDP